VRTTPKLDVLLLDAQYRQVLTCMRVYAHAGLSVGLAACESEAAQVASARSRWCSLSATVPDFDDDPDSYVEAVLELTERTGASMVLPAHDGSIEVLRTRRDDFVGLAALPLASDAALDIALSKERTLGLASEVGIAVPDSVIVSDLAELDTAGARIGFPAVLKPRTPWVVDAKGHGTRLVSELVPSADDARRRLETMLDAGATSALLQPWLPGRREAVTLFRADGRIRARFAQVSHREWPVLGGATVLCESIPLLPDILSSSERLVDAMDLDGCSMVEFRRDRDGRPRLMEVNARMGSSVALAVRAGVDFPSLLHAWAMGAVVPELGDYRIGERLRWLVGDMWFVNTAFARQPGPDVPSPSSAVKTVLADFVVRPSRFDRSSVTDPRPALAEMGHTVRVHALPKVRRVFEMRSRK
jgi:predicted ATP-grasp superfamily ATP-dependent carboligase